jgi:hypothetical protein
VSYASIISEFTVIEFGHAWRDRDGNPCATVRFGESHLSFSSPAHARAVAAACNQAAAAMEALPEVTP